MWAYRAIRELVRLSTFVFFRRVEVVGLEHIPREGGAIIFGNHPNSLLDPALITAFGERKIHFAAKDTLFASPALSWLLKQMGAVPIRRRQDHASESGAQLDNQSAFAALHELLSAGDVMGIFPEGISHDGAQLAAFKTGAARIALGAMKPGVQIQLVPCGLHYLRRKKFRSSVLIQFGAPLTLSADSEGALSAEVEGELIEAERLEPKPLTELMSTQLRALTVNAERWSELSLLDAVRRLYQPPKISLEERVELARRFAAHYPSVRSQPEIQALSEAVLSYQESLYDLGLKDREVAGSLSASHLSLKLLNRLLSLCLWAPLALVGAPIHFPIAYLLGRSSWLLAPRKDVIATTKFLSGFLCLNALYLGVGSLVWCYGGGWYGPLSSLCLALSGLGALKVAEHGSRLFRVTWLCARCLFDRGALKSLRARRRALREAIWRAVDQNAPEELERLFKAQS